MVLNKLNVERMIYSIENKKRKKKKKGEKNNKTIFSYKYIYEISIVIYLVIHLFDKLHRMIREIKKF